MKNNRASRSKTGLPVIRECGGGSTNTGFAEVVAGVNGEALKPLFIPRGYSNAEHALFVARSGMHLVQAEHGKWGESVTVRRVRGIGNEEDTDILITELVAEYENGDGNIPDYLQAAADAALEKARCYHCREPHYIG